MGWLWGVLTTRGGVGGGVPGEAPAKSAEECPPERGEERGRDGGEGLQVDPKASLAAQNTCTACGIVNHGLWIRKVVQGDGEGFQMWMNREQIYNPTKCTSWVPDL
jgi:hypothetical protein